jgi:cytochrome c oxidase subunit 2
MNELLRRLLFLPPQASTYSKSVDWLHFAVIGTTMLGALGVFVLALYYVVRYRRHQRGETTPRTVTTLPSEIATVVFILALFLTWWVVGYRGYETMVVPPPNAVPVYVTAKQWMWKFSYGDGRSSIDVLTVPVGTPIKLVMTSRDVIHSFYVPAFRMKQDLVPGRYTTAWFEATEPGVYEILCAEYCGTSHSRMRGTVLVLSRADYSAWLERRATTSADAESSALVPGADLVRAGRDTAVRRACVACHSVDGQPHVGPTWAGLFGSDVRLADGRTVRVDEWYLTRSMMDPADDVVAGYKPLMPTYRGILDQSEVAALVEYIKSLESRPIAPSVALPDAGVAPQATAPPVASTTAPTDDASARGDAAP